MVGFTLHGRPAFRRRGLYNLLRAVTVVSLRRLVRGPRVPGWTWRFELTTRFLRDQMQHAVSLPSVADAREYLESLIFHMPAVRDVEITEWRESGVQGKWFVPRTGVKQRTVLYFHGGGYMFYTKAHYNLIASVALATQARLLALDYRLVPEHPYPSQLEDALAAYRWLLDSGCPPQQIVLAGDSAGGNLVVATLLGLRAAGLPQPALGVGICPWTNLSLPESCLRRHAAYDWIQGSQTFQCAQWFQGNADLMDPMLSPVYADVRGLAPMYLQAGGREILHDMIIDFARSAGKQGADVTLDIWENMNHDFPVYGDLIAESREAYARMRAVVDQYCEPRGKVSMAPCPMPGAELAEAAPGRAGAEQVPSLARHLLSPKRNASLQGTR